MGDEPAVIMNEFLIMPLKREYLKPVVEIHLEAFPGFFLTFLGPCFLKTFYGSFIGEKTAVAWVAQNAADGKVLGAVFGTTSPKGFFKRLVRRKWAAFGGAALGALVKKPSIARRLFRALFYRGDPPSRPGLALLSSIAVSPGAQGKGVGKALLDRWASEAEKRGCPGAYLTTDADGNDAVNEFYIRSGWTVEAAFVTPEGRRMNRYVVSFPGDGR